MTTILANFLITLSIEFSVWATRHETAAAVLLVLFALSPFVVLELVLK